AATTLRWIDRSSRASIFRRIPFLTLLIALALTACALMDPVLPFAESQIQSRGLDIVVVLDLSSSMQEEMERARPARAPQNVPVASRGTSPTSRPPGKTRLEAVNGAIKTYVTIRRVVRIVLGIYSDYVFFVEPSV